MGICDQTTKISHKQKIHGKSQKLSLKHVQLSNLNLCQSHKKFQPFNLVCPIRWARSEAWRSACDGHFEIWSQRSKMIKDQIHKFSLKMCVYFSDLFGRILSKCLGIPIAVKKNDCISLKALANDRHFFGSEDDFFRQMTTHWNDQKGHSISFNQCFCWHLFMTSWYIQRLFHTILGFGLLVDWGPIHQPE